MYTCFLSEVHKDVFMRAREQFLTDVYFTTNSELRDVIEFINKFGLEEYKNIFDKIEIKYDTIADNGLSFTLGGEIRLLSELSSGERIILYMFIISRLDKQLLIVGLLDRIDGIHRKLIFDNFADNNKIVLLNFDMTLRNSDFYECFYKSFDDLLKEGVVKL